MRIDLSGQWSISLLAENGEQSGTITLPGCLQGQGYGNPISHKTPWVSGLHDSFWYEQEEYKLAQEEEVLVPFLAQPPKHFLGKAFYEREFIIEENNESDYEEQEWFLRIESTHWRSKVWIDDTYMGEDCSLCTAHEIPCGRLTEGRHVLKVCIDNSMQYPYRPDGHGVSDALGATWNGMAGEIILETADEQKKRSDEKHAYAASHPRKAQVRDGKFYIDGHPEYFRGTHFGGDYPLTGYTEMDKAWWIHKMKLIKEWGLNAIRFHSYCPPEVAFTAADEEGVYLLVECGMWNIFDDGIEMLDVLRKETRRILKEFGHHPSFVFFSPSNEPGGNWYQVLRQWVSETREYDKELGYGGRRLYTAESGWFYDVEPSKITGTDFVYFHRSAYGPYNGGVIRNHLGWKGRDYSPSLNGIKQPVLSHELGQWCVYPDFDVIDKFTGYMKPSNYIVYKEQAKKQGLLPLNKELVWCSGKNQLRLYKEELEANFRTPEISGFELLDLHDYLGQGTALVGLLDPFWDNKGYVTPEEFKDFCGETVLLTRCPSYVWRNDDVTEIPVDICYFGRTDLQNKVIKWSLAEEDGLVYSEGTINVPVIKTGENTVAGKIKLDFTGIKKNTHLILQLTMDECKNFWDIYVFAKTVSDTNVLYTRDWKEAKEALVQGERVVYAPHLSELNFECPGLSMKNVYWNSQMGPTWVRNIGLAVKEEHPLFADFPTDKSGGWQWEDILENARGIDLRELEEVEPIVRPIDDWNRSLPLGLLVEAQVEKGHLLLVSADLEGDFESRPAAYALKQAIIKYAASKDFNPQTVIPASKIEERLFPMLRMEELVEEFGYDEDAQVTRMEQLFDSNPNHSVRIEKKDFPVTLEITLNKSVEAHGWIYLPEQRDRGHEGFLRDYELQYLDENGIWKQAAKGTFLNTSLSQKVLFEETINARKWRLVVYSCYGCEDKEVWLEKQDGWYKEFRPKSAVLQIAGLHLICDEQGKTSDDVFWGREQRSATKEIEN